MLLPSFPSSGLLRPVPCSAADIANTHCEHALRTRIANTQVDPRWRPYVGDDSWEDIQKKMNPKKHGKRKKAGKGKAEPKAAGGPPPPSAPASSTSAEAENVIAAYTGGLDQR